MGEAALATNVASHPEPGTLLDVVANQSVALGQLLTPLGATNLAVFGSVARREERLDSDVDLLVDLDDQVGLFALLRMQTLAQELLGRKVDIVPRAGLKPELTETILAEAVSL